jgi:hypothetical protein
MTPSLVPSTNCAIGIRDVSTDPNSVVVLYWNQTSPPLNRRLTGLSFSLYGGPGLVSVSFGSDSNVIWAGGPLTGTITLHEADWISSNRALVTGTSRLLRLTFDQPPGGIFSLFVTWDDGFGGNMCNSPYVTLP